MCWIFCCKSSFSCLSNIFHVCVRGSLLIFCSYREQIGGILFHFFKICIYVMSFRRDKTFYIVNLRSCVPQSQYSIFFLWREKLCLRLAILQENKIVQMYADHMGSVNLNDMFISLTDRLGDSKKSILYLKLHLTNSPNEKQSKWRLFIWKQQVIENIHIKLYYLNFTRKQWV